ncbi:hypothetical protein DICVIV_07695 [Dictyocaulus viviparus]|uniref:Uncharacterized protein n=1 Tax=Dictyocaulus viviparus TaxID=29172 RepID=A0A0D8XR37_DICVI|nr:hypothetical protein DICVIV_07695 [Dictyocaulus viviparus]
MVITKNQAVLSYYFRHFFSHRFHPDVMEQSLLVFETIEDSVEEMEELQGDLVGILVAATSSFYNNNDLEISVDDEVFTMFEQTAIDHATHSIKQIRYLENADLHLEQIHIYESSSLEQPQFPSSQSIISRIDWSQTASKYPPQPFETFLLDVPVSMRRNLRHIYSPILSCREFGARLSDIQDATNMELHEIETGIEYLTKNSQVITVGVEVQRWVAAEFAKAWCVKVGHRLTSPRPWTMPSGDICPATVRWMGESVLMMIISSPGITLKEVCSRFEFALQPVAVHDLITVLELAGCIRLLKEVFENMSLSSLFQRDVPQIEITYLLPTVDCIERFSRIFGGISLLPAMTGRSDSDKLETQRSSAVDEDLGELNLTLPILQKAN